MKILAIETSGATASCAYIEDNILRAELTVNYKMTHSQIIMPLIDEIAKKTELDMSTLDYIACSAGPGSFTGLRIGAATAKGLALGLNIPLVAVPSLDAMAYNLFMSDSIICPIMDARRGQVYAGIYTFEGEKLVTLEENMAEPFEVVKEKLSKYDKRVIFLGDGVAVHMSSIVTNDNFVIAPTSCNMQRASSVAALAAELEKEGKAILGSEFAPIYLRKSQAERELEEKLNAENGGTK